MKLDIEWLDDNHLRIRDTRFDLMFPEVAGKPPAPGPCLVEKSREMVEFYRERFGTLADGTMFEIGIRWGGSLALFHELLNPRKLVAIDIVAAPPPGLEDYIRANRADESVRPHFGIDQGDAAAVRRVLADEIGDEELDLVIDDGCHWLPESRAAFNTLFPRLRAGGAYVVEDWGWTHWPGAWQEHGGPWPERASVTQLVFEFVMTAASRPDVIESLEVRPALALVRRGPAHLDVDFDVSRCYVTAGRRFVGLDLHWNFLARGGACLVRRLRSAASVAHRAVKVAGRAFERRRALE